MRYVLRCPSQAVHDQVLELIPRFGSVMVDNQKRLTISAEVYDERLLAKLKELGVKVFPDERFEPD